MRLRFPILLAALMPLLAGCGGLVGDFGRPRIALFTDDPVPYVGGPAAAYAPFDVAALAIMTEDERDLRKRAYAILRAPHEPHLLDPRGDAGTGAWWAIKSKLAGGGASAYADYLLKRPYRSVNGRYAQLIADVRADIERVDPFYVTAGRVAKIDEVRGRAAAWLTHLPPAERDAALARIAENRGLVQDVTHAFGERAAAYRYALERLVVAGPLPVAVEAERAIALLVERLAAASAPFAVAVVGAPAPVAVPVQTVKK